jgi:low affinity Fe/Cu permease
MLAPVPVRKSPMANVSQSFRHFAEAIARYSGRPATFLCAVLIVAVWAASGPFFHFGDTWQLVINTGTTIITFLMVFLIQNSQNRDSAALQIKLDELIRATAAHNSLLDLEDVDEETLERIRENYRKLADQREHQAHRKEHGREVEKEDEAGEAREEVGEIDRELQANRKTREGEGKAAS